MLVVSGGAMVFGLFWLAWILITLFYEGFSALSLTLFTQTTPAPGSSGGSSTRLPAAW
jgi:phosphate transport system permease protein